MHDVPYITDGIIITHKPSLACMHNRFYRNDCCLTEKCCTMMFPLQCVDIPMYQMELFFNLMRRFLSYFPLHFFPKPLLFHFNITSSLHLILPFPISTSFPPFKQLLLVSLFARSQLEVHHLSVFVSSGFPPSKRRKEGEKQG